MLLTLICAGIAAWALYMGVKFYRRADWEEPAETSPDFGEMTKKEAKILHVQEVLQEACDEGKLSKSALDEFTHYADHEIAAMKAVKEAWDKKRRRRDAPH